MTYSRYLYLITFALFLYVLFPKDAHAYLDPGTGSYIFQLLIAAVVGLGFVLKMYSRKVKAFFTNRFSNTSDDERH